MVRHLLAVHGRQGEESENEVDRCKLTQTQLLAVNLLAEQSKRSCLQRRRSSPPKLELAEKYLSAAPTGVAQVSTSGRKLKVELSALLGGKNSSIALIGGFEFDFI